MKRISPAIVVNLLILGVSVSLIALSCAGGSGYLPTAEELRASGMASGDGELTSLRRGRALALTECSGCHRFYWPQEYSPGEWDRIVQDMVPRTSLDEGQARDMTFYFRAASEAPAPVETAPAE